ncbi:MAG: hypothetical protein ACLP2F_16455 [Steroidobacteraceae bacterium]
MRTNSKVSLMLPLAAISHLIPARAQPDQGLMESNPAIGHLALTIIALVYVLITLWQS